MESLQPKNDQICFTVTPAKNQRTIMNFKDRNKQESFTKLMGIAYLSILSDGSQARKTKHAKEMMSIRTERKGIL